MFVIILSLVSGVVCSYGWGTFRNVSSLISGVGIFCVGAGLSYYHGIMGLITPAQHGESLFWVSLVHRVSTSHCK